VVESVERPVPPFIPYAHSEKVGIVGSGPAGLMAAWELRRRGYNVTVYDKATTPGGNLTQVIPEFRLPTKVVMKDIKWIESWGVKFCLGYHIGGRMEFEAFQSRHNAILLSSGMGQPRRLNIPGEEAANIYFALPFLERIKAGERPELGSSVIVIGGGNVAIDTALTAKRIGTPSVRVVCLERPDEMSAFADIVQEALEEGIEIVYGWGPKIFRSRGKRALGVSCHLCLEVWKDQSFSPSFDPSVEKIFNADSFLIAVGAQPDWDFLQSMGLNSELWPRRIADPLTLETGLSGVFAAGDMATGAGSVVEAMASGRRAAISIERFLQGDDLRYGRSYSGPYITDFCISTEKVYPAPKQISPRVPPVDRLGMQEVDLGFNAEQALEESRRCLSCGAPVGYNDCCWACLPCEVSCPEQALNLEVPYLLR
jgi:NADPH-dependent glutamate synthase beta subunit-like oxidoreductase